MNTIGRSLRLLRSLAVVMIGSVGVLAVLATGVAEARKPSPTATAPPNSVSGEAFGVLVNVQDKLVQVTVGPTPHVMLPSGGGMVAADLLSISVPNYVMSQTLAVITTGAIGPNVATAQSSATVENLNILNGLVTAKLVVAMSSSAGGGNSASSNAEGSTLVGLTINGVSYGDITPPPNTTIDVPGVATVILNEQVAAGDGVRTSALTVNMIHVMLTGAVLTGDIVVSSAHSDVDFAPEAKQPSGFMTGGGRLGEGGDIATFGLNAGVRQGSPQGHLEYIDHARGLNVHSTVITAFSSAGGTCVTFSGDARVNNVNGFQFTVKLACDNGEPGVGRDSLEISVNGSGLSYSRAGLLTGGNLQLH